MGTKLAQDHAASLGAEKFNVAATSPAHAEMRAAGSDVAGVDAADVDACADANAPGLDAAAVGAVGAGAGAGAGGADLTGTKLAQDHAASLDVAQPNVGSDAAAIDVAQPGADAAGAAAVGEGGFIDANSQAGLSKPAPAQSTGRKRKRRKKSAAKSAAQVRAAAIPADTEPGGEAGETQTASVPAADSGEEADEAPVTPAVDGEIQTKEIYSPHRQAKRDDIAPAAHDGDAGFASAGSAAASGPATAASDAARGLDSAASFLGRGLSRAGVRLREALARQNSASRSQPEPQPGPEKYVERAPAPHPERRKGLAALTTRLRMRVDRLYGDVEYIEENLADEKQVPPVNEQKEKE